MGLRFPLRDRAERERGLLLSLGSERFVTAHHAGIRSANTRSVPTASATAKISCAYARPVQVNMVPSNPGVPDKQLRPPLDSGCDRHHKICDWYRVRAMPATPQKGVSA